MNSQKIDTTKFANEFKIYSKNNLMTGGKLINKNR